MRQFITHRRHVAWIIVCPLEGSRKGELPVLKESSSWHAAIAVARCRALPTLRGASILLRSTVKKSSGRSSAMRCSGVQTKVGHSGCKSAQFVYAQSEFFAPCQRLSEQSFKKITFILQNSEYLCAWEAVLHGFRIHDWCLLFSLVPVACTGKDDCILNQRPGG